MSGINVYCWACLLNYLYKPSEPFPAPAAVISRELASCVEALVAQEQDALPLMHQLNPLQLFLMKVAASAVISALVVAWHDRPRGWCSKDLVQVSLAGQTTLGSNLSPVAHKSWRSKNIAQASPAGRAAVLLPHSECCVAQGWCI